DKALDEVAALKVTVEELTRARSDAEERQVAAQQEIAAVKERLSTAVRERDRARHEFAALKEQVTSSTSPEQTRQQSPGPTKPPKKQRVAGRPSERVSSSQAQQSRLKNR